MYNPFSVRELLSRFIQGFANITAPLTTLTERTPRGIGTTTSKQHSTRSKTLFTRHQFSLLQIFSKQFRWRRTLRLRLGASYHTSDNGHWLPVAYMSKQMLPGRTTTFIYDKELLAIIEALKIWRHYLEGSPHPVEICPIHKNLEYFRSAQSLTAPSRWTYSSPVFDSLFSHRAGPLNKADSSDTEVRSSGGGGI